MRTQTQLEEKHHAYETRRNRDVSDGELANREPAWSEGLLNHLDRLQDGFGGATEKERFPERIVEVVNEELDECARVGPQDWTSG